MVSNCRAVSRAGGVTTSPATVSFTPLLRVLLRSPHFCHPFSIALQGELHLFTTQAYIPIPSAMSEFAPPPPPQNIAPHNIAPAAHADGSGVVPQPAEDAPEPAPITEQEVGEYREQDRFLPVRPSPPPFSFRHYSPRSHYSDVPCAITCRSRTSRAS